MRALRLPLLIATLALAPQAISPASAMPPPPGGTIDIVATAECTADGPVVNFTVTGSDTNTDVDVFFNGVKVLDGAIGTSLSLSGSAAAPGGSVAVSAAATGIWGGGSTEPFTDSITVAVPEDCGGSGRFTGGGKSIDLASGLKVTKGFTIHCDLILSNNLEINWPAAAGRTNQFHMLEHTSANCFDDETIEQRPPSAPVDTIIGVGTGRFNGVDGYTVNFTLVDAGEPGTSDQIGFVITAPGGGVVLNLPLQNITGGNVQAHFDQPHKK